MQEADSESAIGHPVKLELRSSDIPMLRAVLQAGSAAALTREKRRSSLRLAELADFLVPSIPHIASRFDGIEFSEAWMCSAAGYSLEMKRQFNPRIWIRCGATSWQSNWQGDLRARDLEQVAEVFDSPDEEIPLVPERADVALLVEALNLGIASRDSGKAVRRRMTEILEMTGSLLPGVARHFDMLDFHEMTVAVSRSEQWDVVLKDYRCDPGDRKPCGYLCVDADGRTWSSGTRSRFVDGAPEIRELRDYLRTFLPATEASAAAPGKTSKTQESQDDRFA